MGADISDVNLKRTILGAVLRDFEPFESIVSKVSRSRVDDSDEVRRVLRSLLEDGLVGAYLIHAEPPYATLVGPEPDNMQWYWYTITAQGRGFSSPRSFCRSKPFPR
jgi:hypothetical protein